MSIHHDAQTSSSQLILKTEDIPPPSPRTISFASSPNRPPLLSDSENVPHSFMWTEALEHRLVHVQSELKKSQRRWSESQDFWLEEEQNLQDLKRRFKKAQKADANAKKVALAWKRRTFSKSTFASTRSSRKNSAASTIWQEGGDEGETSEVESRRRLSRTNTGGSISNAIRRLSVSVKSRNNTTPSSPV